MFSVKQQIVHMPDSAPINYYKKKRRDNEKMYGVLNEANKFILHTKTKLSLLINMMWHAVNTHGCLTHSIKIIIIFLWYFDVLIQFEL